MNKYLLYDILALAAVILGLVTIFYKITHGC